VVDVNVEYVLGYVRWLEERRADEDEPEDTPSTDGLTGRKLA
jgi:hypothetical protein